MSDRHGHPTSTSTARVSFALMEHHLCVAQIGPDARIVRVSRPFAEAMSLPPADLVGRCVRAGDPDDGLAPLFAALHRAIRAGVVWREQITLRRGGGESRLLRLTVAPAACGWSCWCDDVTWLTGGWLASLLEALVREESVMRDGPRAARLAMVPDDELRP